LNRERQRVSESAYKEARRLVHERDEAPIHVVWNETWLPGIVGLVAGKLVSEFGTPAFAFTKVGDLYVGSGRSIGGLHLVEAMRSCGDIFVKAGGHPQACGLSLASLDHVKLFKDKVTAFAKDFFGEEGSQHLLEIEAALSLDKVTWELFEKIEQFEPFGEKNPRPKFLARELQVLAAKAIGKTRKHLRLTINPLEGPVWKLIGFGLGDWSGRLSIGTMVDVVYEISVNVWNGKKELQCQIVDLLVRGDNPARSA
ncbi:hypothetical protein IH979_02280, partial [Patescibacteria group bacterium]|nr:hypothetical protein [Patescibacteria group bacterium]